MEVERVDNQADGKPLGFHYTRHIKYKQDDEFYRDKWKVYGVRILLRSEGVAHKMSATMIVENLSLGVALFRITWIIADFIMLNFMKDRDEYKRNKVQVTKPFDEEIAKYKENEQLNSKLKDEPLLAITIDDIINTN